MESLSRPLHRRKPSNANGFSGKNAYDGVLSGHRPNYDGASAVNVAEYREIFCTGQTGSSIPVLDLSSLEESSDGLNLEVGSTKPDYGRIFGGFRDQHIAISYEDLVARDKARGPSSTSQTSQDLDYLSHQSSDALKQFNLSYNKISQRSKDGSDGTTHVTQLHDVPGFTCFIDESTSQPNKETVKQKPSSSNNVSVDSSKRDFPEKRTSQSKVEFSKHQDESLSDNRNFKTFETNLKSHPSKVLSSPKSKTEHEKQKPPVTSNVSSSPKKEIKVSSSGATNSDNDKDDQKRSTATNQELPPPCFNEEVVVNSAAVALKKAIEKAQESIRIAKESVGRKKEGRRGFTSKSFKDSLKVKSKVANVNAGEELKGKDDIMKERDLKNGNSSHGEKPSGAKKVINEIHGKVSESVKNSETPITSRFELNNNKVVCNLKQVVGETETGSSVGDEQKEKDDKMKERDHKNGNFYDGKKLFAAKKVINEIHGNNSEAAKNSEIPITSCFELNNNNNNKMVCDSKPVGETVTESVENKNHKNGNFLDVEKLFGAKKGINEIHTKVQESVKNLEIPITPCFELNNNKMVCNSKQVVDETETESVENNECENPRNDDEGPDGFLELESCEKKQEDTEANNLTVCQKVETKKEMSQTCDQNGYEKKFSEESFGLLENNTQENLEQDCEEHEDEDEKQVKQDGGVESHSEEEKFYDVCEAETIKNAQGDAYNIETKDLSKKEEYKTYESSSSDYDDAEENENVIGACNTCKVDQNVDQAEICQDIDDGSSRHTFQVEYKEAVEKEISDNISSGETEDNKDNVDFEQNDVQFESSLDSIHSMEIEVKQTVEKEENNLQQSHEQTPEIRIEMDAGTPQESKDAHREPGPSNNKEETEQVRVKLAVERAIREARERAFAEVRQRVMADTQEKVTKASVDKISAQSKLRTERALVERATAEARQRALEKLEKQTSFTSQTNTESALRSKAKLEKHNRIMERAAQALQEKEKRDMLALREQAERNRLAEYLDADIKRWSTGKEGNLRALLSTLQYILGAESGWQAVSLMDIITTGAVKKAYRKATLCVHPDKLQQRGASIQQKYICEKVFDLLKAAWNRFNSEER